MTDFLDFKTLKRPPKPNNWLVAPPGFADHANPNGAPPTCACSPADLFKRVEAMIAARRDWKLKAADAEAGRIVFIAITPLMRFKDDIDIAVLPDNEGAGESTLAIYSRSRIGYSDLGANAKRVNEILAAVIMP